MSTAEPPNTIAGKGLNTGALGLVGNIVIGLSAVAPAYSLAATLGYVVLAVGDKAPSMFLVAFVPMLLTAFAYRELGRDTPDCGTSFTWGTKAFGPWVGWMGGWGLAVSVTALVKVGIGTAGPQAITPQLSWLVPTGVTMSDAAQAIILCIFIYWGWDACLAVGEETKDSEKTPGRAAVMTTLILVATYVLVGYAVQSFAGFGGTGIGLNNPDNVDDVLSILGDPVAGSIAASLLLLTVSISALSSTQTTILPTARGTLSMAVYEAIPKRFASVHPKYMTPGFGTLVMGAAALMFYLVLTFVSANALQDSVPSLGLAVAFYYGITAYVCTWYFRRTLFSSARNLFMRGIFPLLGGLSMTWAFVQSAVDMIKPDYGYTVYGPIGGVFVLGVGMLVLGIPLMLLCFVGNRDFFQGKTLTASTEVKVPDTY